MPERGVYGPDTGEEGPEDPADEAGEIEGRSARSFFWEPDVRLGMAKMFRRNSDD
jgi:hypothetical protein